MALHGRVARLERTVGTRPAPPCPDCGGPAGWISGLIVRNDDGVELLPACPRCGLALNHAGRAMCPVPPGRGQKVLVLNELPPV